MQGMYSMRSPAVKRLMKEAQELSEPTEQYYCQPLEDNLFEWHFTLRGPADTEFEGGLYHGRIILPPEYPMKPPSIILLTHNGRFEINKKICLSISGHHPESWQPSWSIRTALLAIIGFMPTHGAGALGSLDYTPDERKVLARKSIDFKCSECGPINHTLKAVTEASLKTREEAKQLAAQVDFKNEKEKNAALKKETTEETKQSTSTETSGTTEGTSQSATGAIPKVKTNQPFPQPAQFGQFPMPLPFLPPFPIPGNTQNGQQQGNNVLNQVPRFPLPFAAPFSPPFPQFMPPMPMVPGMSFPAVPAGKRISRTSESGSETMRSPPTESTSQSDQIQSTQSSVVSSSQPSENLPTTTSTPSTLPQSQSTTQTTGEGLRQRNVTETTNLTPQRATAPIQRRTQAEIPRSGPRESVAFVVFAVIILSLIAMLLLRRLYMMKYLSGLI